MAQASSAHLLPELPQTREMFRTENQLTRDEPADELRKLSLNLGGENLEEQFLNGMSALGEIELRNRNCSSLN